MSEEHDENAQVEVDGEMISLADLAGVDLSDIAEQRFSALPEGVYVMRVIAEPNPPQFEVIESKGKKKPIVVFYHEVEDCLALKKPEETPEGINSLIGKKHRETFFISGDAKTSLGYIKTFMVDATGNKDQKGDMKSLLLGMVGTKYQCTITHRKDPNDSDKVYVSCSRGKIRPLGQAAQSGVAGQIAA